jgi:hypothetical protein
VTPFDVLKFSATSLGDTTAGTFSWYLRGRQVGLTQTSERIDAVAQLPDGRTVVSTRGAAAAPGVAAGGEDLLVFTATSLGPTTRGRWSLWLDGSDLGLSGTAENVDAADVAPDGHVLLSTTGAFAATGLKGSGATLFGCTPRSTGQVSACSAPLAVAFPALPTALGSRRVDAIATP